LAAVCCAAAFALPEEVDQSEEARALGSVAQLARLGESLRDQARAGRLGLVEQGRLERELVAQFGPLRERAAELALLLRLARRAGERLRFVAFGAERELHQHAARAAERGFDLEPAVVGPAADVDRRGEHERGPRPCPSRRAGWWRPRA
jgi:hypothetical protein